MVDQISLKQIEKELQEQFFVMLSTRKTLEVCLEEPNLTIYNLYEGNRMTLISEYFAAGFSTAEFKFYI